MKIELNEKYNFYHLISEEGMVLTDWDGEDIREYTSSTELYCPLTVDTSKYYEITVEEDEVNIRRYEEVIAEDEIQG